MRVVCVFFVLGLVFVSSNNMKRELYVELNPNCSNCDVSNQAQSSSINLIYIRADGSSDTIHYLWSTVGTVSMLMAQTNLSDKLIVDWETFLSKDPKGSISFTNQPSYTSVVTLTKLYEYDDSKDKNDITKVSYNDINKISFMNMTWESADVQNVSDDEASANLKISSEVADLFGNQTIQLDFIAYGFEAHANKLPQLLHTPDSFQVEFVLDHFTTRYNKTRFVLEAVMMNSEDPNGKFKLEKFHSIDDEYTPGVFTTVQMTSPSIPNNEWGSFLQWKPVCYKDPKTRTTETSTGTEQTLGDLNVQDRLDELKSSLAYAFYGDEMSDKLQGWINISYGAQQDNFYQDTSYLSWTVTIGLGTPPSESFSTLVIVIIIVGFGVPAVLIIAGGIFILVRRLKSKDDDLSSAKLVEQQDD